MCPEIYPWTGVTKRYQDMLDTGQEFTSLPLVSHRVGRLYISIDLPSLDIGLCRPIISRVCHFHREVKCLFPNINYSTWRLPPLLLFLLLGLRTERCYHGYCV